VRQHLAVLKETDLVTEEVEMRDSPGRPRLLYRLHPEAAGKWETSGAYAWLAGLLGEAMKRNLSADEVGRKEGLRRGQEYAGGSDSGDSVDVVERELTRSGFRPTRSERGRQVDFVLGRCPFAEVAAGNPETVCQLHLGLAEGLAQGLGDVTMVSLRARDPHRAGCRLVIKREPESDHALNSDLTNPA
jgi:predicted ArsR family transcriptional regulator